MRRSSLAAQSKTSFALPFTLGTALGVISGVTVGALLGHRVFGALLQVWSLFSQDSDREPPFDLLLQ